MNQKLALLATAFSLWGCSGATPIVVAPDGKPLEHTLSVVGSARVEVVPDEACVELTLVARDPAMPAAHAQLSDGRAALRAALDADREIVVEEGATRYEPDYEPDRLGRAHLIGYVASVQVNVRTKRFARIADVVGHAATRGLERVNVTYYATDMVARRAEVRTRALDAAKAKAQVMAERLDVKLGDAMTISEGDVNASLSTGASSYLARGAVDAAPDVPAPPGSIPLAMSVNVVYGLR